MIRFNNACRECQERPVVRTVLAAASIAAVAVVLPQSAAASDFYAGKTISLSTHTTPGNSYDLYLRLLSRHFGRHIPGQPRLMVLNQPGGGGLTAVNHAAKIGAQDGTLLTLVSQGLLIFEATGQRGLQASLGAFRWIGSFTQSNNVTVTWHTSPIKTIEDAMKRDVIVGATGTGAGSTVGPVIYNAVLGTKFKLVSGYPGGAEIDIAMQRGEVEGRGNNTWAGYKATFQDAIRNKHLNVLIQTGLRKEPDLPHVPLFMDMVRGDAKREPVAKFMSYAVAIARPLAAPPGVPGDRIAILRRAWDATMKDPAFLADAEKLSAEIDPLTGERVQDIVENVLATPKPVRNQIQVVLGLPPT
jgi:tripartite-type tricarboxylate transporter receptor subunit TctC